MTTPTCSMILAGQTVRHFESYLQPEEVVDVVRCHQHDIARFIHAQMQEHYWEEVAEYEVKVSKGFTELKPSAYTCAANEPPADYRVSPADKSNMSKYLFGGFDRCLYPVQKFDSDAERKLAVILERDAVKWFKPAKGQFQIFYRHGADHLEYQPDFVAETADTIYMLEPKASNQMEDPGRARQKRGCRQMVHQCNGICEQLRRKTLALCADSARWHCRQHDVERIGADV